MTGFSFDASGYRARELNDKIKRAGKGALQFHRPGAEEYMKHNAPWSDRTTNARNGLGARVRGSVRGSSWALVLFGTVDYQIYLELGTENMDEYPIIMPTVGVFASKVQATLSGLMDKLDAMGRRA